MSVKGVSEEYSAFSLLRCFLILYLVSDASCTTNETAAFNLISDGNCYDHGLFPIKDAEVCEAAAWILHMPDIRPSIHYTLHSTEGCHYKFEGSKRVLLSLNLNPDNKGHGFTEGEGEGGTVARHPICSSVANPSMSNVESKPGSCYATNLTEMTDEYYACLRDTCTNYNDTIIHELASAGRWGYMINRYRYMFKCAALLNQGALCNSTPANFSMSARGVSLSLQFLVGKKVEEQLHDVEFSQICPRYCTPCSSPTSDATSDTTSDTQVSVNGAARLSTETFRPVMRCATLMLIALFIMY